MKKTLAILLSCMLVVCAICAVALSTNAEVAPSASVVVTTGAGDTTLDATTTSVACTTGTATFDAATGTLTLDGTTGITKINPAAGVFTVKVVGTNTVDGGTATNILWVNSGDLVITGDGTLNISGKEYVVGANGNVTFDGPTVNVNGNGWTTTHIGGASLNGVYTVKGNTVLKIVNASGGPAIDIAGINSKLVVTDNAKVTINTPGTGIQVRVSMATTADHPTHGATVEFSGKSQIVVEKGNQGLQVNSQYKDADNKLLPTVGFVPSVTIKDEASFTSKASGQGIVIDANVAGSDKAVLQILDKANVDIECIGAGNYQQGISFRGGKGSVSGDIDITTTGTVKIKSNAQGWSGAFQLTGTGGIDVLIKDANIELSNPGGKQSQVVLGFYAQVKTNLVVSGNAKITSSAERMAAEANLTPLGKNGDASTRTNRSLGFYLASGSTAVFKDNAQLTTSVGGDANASWAHGASGIYLNASTLTVQDNVVINSTAGGISIPAVALEGASTLNVKGNAVMNLKSTSADALRYVSNTATVNVTENGVINCDAKNASVALGAAGTQNYAAKNAISEKTNVLASKVATAPTNVASSDVTANSAKITWDKVSGASGYKVYAGEDLVATVTTNEATIDTIPEKAYSVTVKTINAAGVESAASAATTFTTPAGQSSIVVPAAPANVKVSAVSQTTAKVTWDAVEGATSYDVYVGADKVASVTETTASLADLTAATDYKVTVKAVNAAGASASSAEVSFKTVKEGVVTSVEVVMADGSKVVLDAENTTANGATGTVVFDITTGSVTLTDVTGVQSVLAATNVDLTVIVKGTNTLEGAATNNLRAYHLTIAGDGTLNINGKGSYAVLGQKNITIEGDVTFNLNATGGIPMHVARGFKNTAGDDNCCAFTFKGNAKINIKNTSGYAIYGTGHKVSLIITDKADVTLESTSDTIFLNADTICKTTDIVPGTYFEVSGDAKLKVLNGNCGYRGSYNVDCTADANKEFATVAGHCAVVFKGNAQVDMKAPGQVVYPVDSTKGNTAKNTASFELAGNAKVKLTVGGPASNGNYYPCLQLNSDANTVKILGGTMEMDGSAKKNVFAITGKTTYEISEGTVVKTGDDKDSLKEASSLKSLSTSAKYMVIEGAGNPDTSDFVPAAAVVALFATVACAAMIVLRKKVHNA